MVLGFIQETISELIVVGKAKEIGLDFSFANDVRMNEDKFYRMLEIIEEEMEIELIECAWRFETVKNLIDYIEKNGLCKKLKE